MEFWEGEAQLSSKAGHKSVIHKETFGIIIDLKLDRVGKPNRTLLDQTEANLEDQFIFSHSGNNDSRNAVHIHDEDSSKTQAYDSNSKKIFGWCRDIAKMPNKRRGGKKSYSSKFHSMKTRNSKSSKHVLDLTGEKQVDVPIVWNLENEIAKVIEKGVALGGIFNQRSEKEGPCPFRFYNSWIEDEELMIQAKKGWLGCKVTGPTTFILASKVKSSKIHLKNYIQVKKKANFSLQACEKRLDLVEKKDVSEGWIEVLRKGRYDILEELWKGIRKKEQIWRQKSRVQWLKEGDKNSKYFNCLANSRRRINYIGEITIDGCTFSDPSTVKEEIKDFPRISSRKFRGRDLLLKVVASLFAEGTVSKIMLKDGLKVVIGDGKRTNFWDVSTGEVGKLSEVCPRIFALAVKKQSVVHDFGFWDGPRWVWEVILWRTLFDWEKDQWRAFVSLLEGIHVHKSFNDILAWSFEQDGKFKVGYFRKMLEGSSQATLISHNIIWQGLCVEAKHQRVWNTLLLAVIWTIWEFRNQLIFRGIPTDLQKASDTVKFRDAWWVKHLGKGSKIPISTMLLNIRDNCSILKPRKCIQPMF
ncbi:hypothetical protein Ddye_004375 [Dipteronia dyeriana]|uniref:Reverse transcriptase zinc-binding domain-containing protein n=1 Tax=Dipteronia dyeriana TaxID=168575 RepID=A0AAE0CW92_9ROSI|nr:hypothetical protein Ddye_004375 [Dipteronia dyeriana]